MDLALFLSCLALLIVPGPTNILLFGAGLARGSQMVGKALLAVCCGYAIAVSGWSLLCGMLFSHSPFFALAIKTACALYLFLLSFRAWRTVWSVGESQPLTTPRPIFTVTLLNPKAFIFASAMFPLSLWGNGVGYLHLIVPFSGLVALVSLVWISAGRLMGARLSQQNVKRLLGKGSALVLSAFAVVMMVNGLSQIAT